MTRRAVAYARLLAACPLLAVSVALAAVQVAVNWAAEAVAGVPPSSPARVDPRATSRLDEAS